MGCDSRGIPNGFGFDCLGCDSQMGGIGWRRAFPRQSDSPYRFTGRIAPLSIVGGSGRSARKRPFELLGLHRCNRPGSAVVEPKKGAVDAVPMFGTCASTVFRRKCILVAPNPATGTE